MLPDGFGAGTGIDPVYRFLQTLAKPLGPPAADPGVRADDRVYRVLQMHLLRATQPQWRVPLLGLSCSCSGGCPGWFSGGTGPLRPPVEGFERSSRDYRRPS